MNSSARALRITSLCGNPRRGSRTLAVATQAAAALSDAAAGQGIEVSTSVIDLAALGEGVLDPSAVAVGEALATARNADLLLVATPVYKGSYTGLLKLFLDEMPNRALAGVTAVPVTLQGAADHLLAADVHLRPLLVELGASVPTRALALLESQLSDGSDPVQRWAREEAPVALQAALTQTVLSGRPARAAV